MITTVLYVVKYFTFICCCPFFLFIFTKSRNLINYIFSTMFYKVPFLIILLIIFFMELSVAQIFSGRVIAEDSSAISYSTIYSRESGIGITADKNGLFSVRIPVGKYRFEISALGFKARTIDVNIDEDGYDCTIMLREQVYNLNEVTIKGSDEDPAYRVMRYVLVNAGKNKRHIDAYSVTNYAKGTGRIMKLPELFRLSNDFARDSAELCGSVYVMEGVYNIYYKYPSNYNTEVVAFKSSFPIEMPIQVWNPSDIDFYSDYVGGGISPLGRNALSAYDFKLEGYYMNDEGRMINKIRLIPKSNNSKAFTGHVYIVEDLWCLSDADLYISNSMYSINLVVNAKEMRNGVFLPATSSLKANVSIMGMELSFGIFSSSSYSDIDATMADSKSNNSVAEVSDIITNNRKKECAKRIENEITEIMAGDELNSKKAMKVFRLNDKLSELQITDTLKGAERYNLDLRAVRKRNVLDGAMTRDSIYWASVRFMPLNEEEVLSYKKYEEKELLKDSVKVSVFTLLIEHKFYNRTGKLWIKSPGLDRILYDINAVDGFNIGADVEFGVNLNNDREISLRSWGYYLTHRKDVNYGVELKVDYAPAINGRMAISGGRETADYNGTRGYKRYFNMLSTFLFGDNYAKFYDNKFIRFDNSIDIANGLNLAVEAEYSIRSVLNNTIHKFRKYQLEPNIPASENYRSMLDNSMLHFSGSIKYTPASYYRYVGGRKIYIKSKFPTFTALYAHGFDINNETDINSVYHKIEFGISHTINFVMSNLNYWMNAGIFIDSENVYFPDFHHILVNPFYLSFYDDKDYFTLPGNYEYSTSDNWISGGTSYKTSRILLNFIPFLGKSLNTESVGFRTIVVKGLPIFNEIEYRYNSMDIISIGVAVAFRGDKYTGIGFTVGMPISKTLFSYH